MNHSDSLNELAAALCKAQAVMKGAPKDAQNPHFRSRFASLASVWDACRGPLTDNGLSVLQTPGAAAEVVVDGEVVADGRAVTVTTMLLHASGQWIKESLTMTARDATPQSVGSAITYARRYGLQAAVGICPEDDDGNAASHPAGEVHEAYRPQPARPQAPARRPQANGNGHHGGEQARQYDGPPKTGKALFAFVKDQEQKLDLPLLAGLTKWAKSQDFPARMTEFTAEQVTLAHAEVLRKIGSLRSAEEIGAPRGREPGQEG
jgi:hypothetical protein